MKVSIQQSITKWLDNQMDFNSFCVELMAFVKQIESYHYPQTYFEHLVVEFMRIVDSEMLEIVGQSDKISEETGLYLQMISNSLKMECDLKKIQIDLPFTKELSHIMVLQTKDVLTDAIDEICPHIETKYIIGLLRILQKQRVESISENAIFTIERMKRTMLSVPTKPILIKQDIIQNVLSITMNDFGKMLSLDEVKQIFVDRPYFKANSLYGEEMK